MAAYALEIIVALVMSFGLVGMSASEIQSTLNDAGFGISAETAGNISDVANDPVKLNSVPVNESFNAYVDYVNDSSTFWHCVEDVYGVAADMYLGNADPYVSVDVPILGEDGRVFYDDVGGQWKMKIERSLKNSQLWVQYYFVYINSKGEETLLFNGSAIDEKKYQEGFKVDYAMTMNGDGTYTVTLIRTWTDPKGEGVTALSYHTFDLPVSVTTFEEELTDSTITDIPVNPDGSITLPDGTVIYPNPDGTYTIDGVTYAPTVGTGDMTNEELLQYILNIIKENEKEENKPYVPEFEKEKEKTAEEIEKAIEEAAGYDGVLSELMMSSGIIQVFPFCLPFDFVRGVKLFMATPVPPVFEVDFVVPPVGAFQGINVPMKIDFKIFESAAVLIRWFSTAGFIFNLIVLTGKIVKGAGA